MDTLNLTYKFSYAVLYDYDDMTGHIPTGFSGRSITKRMIRLVEPRMNTVHYKFIGTIPTLNQLVRTKYQFDGLENLDLRPIDWQSYCWPMSKKSIYLIGCHEVTCCDRVMTYYLCCSETHDKIQVYENKDQNLRKLYYIGTATEHQPFVQIECRHCKQPTNLDICFINGYDTIYVWRARISDWLPEIWTRGFFLHIFTEEDLTPQVMNRMLRIVYRKLDYRSIHVMHDDNHLHTVVIYHLFITRIFGDVPYSFDMVDQLLFMAGIERNPGPVYQSFDEELHAFTETIVSMCHDEMGDIITSFKNFLETTVKQLPRVCRHTLRVVLRIFMLSNCENYAQLTAQVADLILANDSHVLLDSTTMLLVGKCITLIYRYIRSQIYKLKSQTDFEEDLHSFEMSGQQIGSMVCALGACLASMMVIGRLPPSKDVDSFVNRCHSIPRAFKSIAEIFAFFEKSFRDFIADGTLPFLSKIGGTSDKDVDNFVTEIEVLLQDMHKDEAMLDTRLCRKAKTLYESHLQLIKVASDTKNGDMLSRIRNYSPILNSIYNRAIKAPGSGVQFRQEPCALTIFGPPGVGKTRLAQVIAMHCYKACGVTQEELMKHESTSFIYSKLVGQKYWTNYNSTQHAVTILDDANQVQLNYIDGSPFPCQFINLKNSAACPLEVAECDLKKLAYFNSNLIIVTDNASAPPVEQVITSAEAYFRRFDFQIKCVKCSDDKDMINFSHLKFEIQTRNLEKGTFTSSTVSLEELIPLVIERIGVYKQLYKTNASDDKLILNKYYSDETHSCSTFQESQVLSPLMDLSIFHLMATLPWYSRLSVLSFFWWTRYIRRRSTAMSIILSARRMPVNTWFDCLRTIWRNRVYRTRILTITTFLWLLGLIVGITKLYFYYKKKDEQEIHSYSNRAKTRGAAKIRISKQSLKSSPHTLEVSPPFRPMVKNGDIELTCASRPLYGEDTNLEEMMTKVMNNVYLAEFRADGRLFKNHMTVIKGKIAITNWHFVEVIKEYMDMADAKLLMKRPVGSNFLTFNLDPKMVADSARIWTGKENFVDAGMVCLGIKVPNHKDISKYLMTSHNLENLTSGFMKRLSIHPTRETTVVNTGALLYQYDSTVSYPWNDDDAKVSVWPKNVIYYQADSEKGMCGSPVFVVDPTQSRKIIGFAMAYNHTLGASVACHLPPEVIGIYESQLPEIIGNYESHLARICLEDTEPHSFEHSAVVGEQYFDVGKYAHTVVLQRKTAITPSICFDQITPHISKPAKLQNFVCDGEEVDVLKRAISKNLNTSCKISDEHLEIAKHHIDYLFSKIVDEKPFKLSWEQVIKGGIPGLQPIPRSTSPGAPYVFQTRYKPGKQQFLGSDETYILDDKFLLSQISNFSSKSARNIRSIEPYTVQLKDETRDFERVSLGKTRSFMACNLTMTCKIREYFGFFFAKTHCNGKTCGLLPGFNPHGEDSNFVFRYITQVGGANENIFGAGDFSNFDGTLNEEILNLIIKKWIESLDLSAEQYGEALMCGLNIMNAVYLLSDHLYMNTHSLPSGCPATTILNSWYNSTICAITMYEAVKKRNLNAMHYRSFYRLLVYGDDNLFALSPVLCDDDISSDITGTMKLLGMTYTSGTKKGDIVFTDLWSNEILKRTFKLNSKLSRYVMPLRVSVIMECLNWDRKKSFQDKIIQFQQNVEFVTRELALHGQEVFEQNFGKVQTFAMEKGIDLPFYSYNGVIRQLDTERTFVL